MEEIIKLKKEDLIIEEKNILSSAYKNCVSSCLIVCCGVYGVKVKEKSSNSKFLYLVTDLKATLEK